MAQDTSLTRFRVRKTETMLTIIGVPDVPGSGAGIFSALAKEQVPITMIVQNAPDAGSASITFTVNRRDEETALAITRQMVEHLGAVGLMHDDSIARLSVVGREVLEDAVGIAGEFFSVLAAKSINVLAINATSDAVSCIIEDVNVDKAVELLCRHFGLEAERIE